MSTAVVSLATAILIIATETAKFEFCIHIYIWRDFLLCSHLIGKGDFGKSHALNISDVTSQCTQGSMRVHVLRLVLQQNIDQVKEC